MPQDDKSSLLPQGVQTHQLLFELVDVHPTNELSKEAKMPENTTKLADKHDPILEMAVELIRTQASHQRMDTTEMVSQIKTLYTELTSNSTGVPTAEEPAEEGPAVSLRKAFGKNKVYCMICGKGMTMLSKHVRQVHGMTPAEYRAKFGIPASQSLAAGNYVEQRRKDAIEKGLGDNLAKARAAKKTVKK